MPWWLQGLPQCTFAAFYEEAARRLPLEEMPGLDGCICAGIGYRSISGLRGFMTNYFRYLGPIQAQRYLYVASHNLPLAIRLVHHDRSGPKSSLQQLRLLPDGGKFKAALRIAAVQSKHPEPDLLAQLMTAQYPPELLSHVLAKLQGTEPLTAGDLSEIMDLLDRQWPPAFPPVNMEFWCRPNGTTCTRGKLLISACIGGNLIAEIKISTDLNYYRFKCISDLTFHCEDMEAKLSDCLQTAGRTSGMKTMVSYDEFRCEHIVTLELCLLDTIHTFYIKALAILPSSPCLLRALVVAGHCYGPMDPVSNIILNTIWYDIAFPLPEDAKVELPRGILDTRSMFRLAYNSLDGLVEMARRYCSSRHEALQYLNSFDCDLYHEFLLERGVSYNAFNYYFVAKAAKHPQHAAHGKFLMSLPLNNMIRLRELLRAGGTWCSFRESILKAMPVLAQKEEAPVSLSPFASMEISRKKMGYKDKLTFVCSELEKVLQKYCHQHPWEPTYKLVTVCGVRESRSPYRPNLFHANFLASKDTAEDDDIIPSSEFPGRTLFFAEFWGPPSPGDVQSKPSSCCCPIYNYRAYTGRCSPCEKEGSKILHPPSGGHSGVIDGLSDLYPSAVTGVGFKGLLDLDFIYFDPDRDVELAKVINDLPHYGRKDMPVVTWTHRAKPSSLVWGWSGDNLFGPLPTPKHEFKLSFS